MRAIRCRECIKYIKDTNNFINDLIDEIGKKFRLLAVLRKGYLDQLIIKDKKGESVPVDDLSVHVSSVMFQHSFLSKAEEIETIVTQQVRRWCLYHTSAEAHGVFILSEPPKVRITTWLQHNCPILEVTFKHIRIEPEWEVSLTSDYIFTDRFYNNEVNDHWYELKSLTYTY